MNAGLYIFVTLKAKIMSKIKFNVLCAGSSKNFVEDSEYKELTSDQEYLSWKYWFPYNISGSGNTFLYLVVTAVTVLLFTLGHNFIEVRTVVVIYYYSFKFIET